MEKIVCSGLELFLGEILLALPPALAAAQPSPCAPAPRPPTPPLTAFFESPLSGPVAGVQVVRGWAFVPEPGDPIARVELVVDGAPAMTIPCCGERGDVAAAYPQYPPEVTLRSGWGLTFNWSLLPPGLHTVQVEITTAQGQQWRSEGAGGGGPGGGGL